MKQKDNHWFAHDKNAMNDPKLMSLKAVYGMKGYGIWWALMEVLRGSEGYRYNLTEEFAYTHLSRLLEEMTPDEVRKFIDDCINRFKLLKLKNGCIYHEEMTEQLRALDRKRKELSNKGKRAANIRYSKPLTDNELSTTGMPDACPMHTKERTTEDRTEYNSIAHNSTAEDGGVATVVGGKTAISLIPDNTKHITPNDTHYTLEQLLERSMADDNFNLLTTELKKITPEQLRNWLTAFNKWLRYTAETEKTDTDYRKHFRNWLGHHDVKTENPLTYNPAADAQKPKGKYALPPAPVGISAKEALRRHKEEMERSRKIDEDLAIARGKIKPEDLGRAS